MGIKNARIDAEYESLAYTPRPNPERLLLAAILARAILDLGHKQRHVVRDAIAWFKRKAGSPVSFSYTQVIEMLELRPSELARINKRIYEALYDECLCEGKEGGEKHCELAEGEGMQVSPPDCATLRPTAHHVRRVVRPFGRISPR